MLGTFPRLAGTLLDTEELSSQALQKSVDKYDKKFTWDIKQKILGMRREGWAPIVISGEILSFRRRVDSPKQRAISDGA